MDVWNSIWSWWDGVFFAPTNTLTDSVLRILVGVIMIHDTLSWSGLSGLLISPDGWYAYKDYQEDKEKYFYFSVFKYLPRTYTSVRLIIWVQMLASVMILLGIWPNIFALLAFITLNSIHNRNLYVLNSGDTVRRFLLLYLVFAPSAYQLSILNLNQLVSNEAVAWPFALVLLKVFTANIYFKNIFYKIQGRSWQNGTATKLALNVRIINRFRIPGFLDRKWFYALTTYGTLLVETALFTLIWFEPFRVPVLIMGMCLHAGMAIFLKLPQFQLSMIILLCSFIKPEEFQLIIDILIK